jgi:hypothetical protein
MRFYEHPLRAPARIAFSARWLGIGISTGAGFSFLVALGAMLTLDEAFHDFYDEFSVDAPARALVGLLFAALFVGLGVYTFADSALNWTLARQLRRAAETTPDRVPPRDQRRVLALASPSTAMNASLWVIVGSALAVLLIFFAILGESSDEDLPVSLAIMAGLAATAVVGIVATWVVRRARLRVWPVVVGAANEVWTDERIAEAVAIEKANRRKGLDRIEAPRGFRQLAGFASRAATITLALILGGFAVGFVGVWMRQPCRRCDERTWESFGESVIDFVLVAGVVIVAIGVAAAVAGLAATIAANTLEVRALREAIGTRPTAAQLQRQLMGTPPYLSIGLVMAGLGTFVAVTGATLAVAAESPLDAYAATFEACGFGGLALLVAAIPVFAIGEAVTTRWRNELRDRWMPGDVESERPAPRRR